MHCGHQIWSSGVVISCGHQVRSLDVVNICGIIYNVTYNNNGVTITTFNGMLPKLKRCRKRETHLLPLLLIVTLSKGWTVSNF